MIPAFNFETKIADPRSGIEQGLERTVGSGGERSASADGPTDGKKLPDPGRPDARPARPACQAPDEDAGRASLSAGDSRAAPPATPAQCQSVALASAHRPVFH